MTTSVGRLNGKRAVVLGAGSGWGRAAAVRLAREGAWVAGVDPNAEALKALSDEAAAFGGEIVAFPAKTDDPAELAGVAERLGAAALDICVTHYLRSDMKPLADCDLNVFADTVRFNLVGPVIAVKAFLPLLKRSTAGAVVHLGSVDGLYGNPRVPAYSASKGGLVALTHVMAHEFAPFNIRVNAIASALTDQFPDDADDGVEPATPSGSRVVGAYTRQLNEATPLKRRGAAERWAGPVAFLASDDAEYVTGAVLVVDCGRTAITPGTA
jgi:NAD(P)-dependent dehydrogenase (short-subunit alcohol dehydrogenase family)